MMHTKEKFIKGLAKFLVTDQSHKSMLLSLPDSFAKELAQQWAELRGQTPLEGYPTLTDAERILTEFLK